MRDFLVFFSGSKKKMDWEKSAFNKTQHSYKQVQF